MPKMQQKMGIAHWASLSLYSQHIHTHRTATVTEEREGAQRHIPTGEGEEEVVRPGRRIPTKKREATTAEPKGEKKKKIGIFFGKNSEVRGRKF